ncbi:MAG: PPC domain-containing DNA-binding protein [Pseudobdellovibrio sp.]
MKIYCLRLQPNDDLKLQLAKICIDKNISAGCILSSVGSLKKLNLRLANSKGFLNRDENLEIISLNGTISKNGIHLHASVSDGTGQVLGGHVAEGNIIYTTCELIIADLQNFQFKREHDSNTGFQELQIITSKTT